MENTGHAMRHKMNTCVNEAENLLAKAFPNYSP